jgi:hypothetical protein
MLSLNLLAAHTHRQELQDRAHPRPGSGGTPVTRVILREASAADAQPLRDLAALDSALAPTGPVLVAEVDGRLRAALALDGQSAIADPFYRGRELLELLRIRARQLA